MPSTLFAHSLGRKTAWQGKVPKFTPTLIQPVHITFSYSRKFEFIDKRPKQILTGMLKEVPELKFVNLFANPFRVVIIIPKYAYPTLATNSNVVFTEFVLRSRHAFC